MKKPFFAIFVTVAFTLGLVFGLIANPKAYPHNVSKIYRTGDTLYPDYAVRDTLRVVNEEMLNRVMPYCITDYEISAILYAACDVIPEDKYHPVPRDYQIDIYMDTVWVWDGPRYVDMYITDWKSKLDTIMLDDNR